jgi:hypothetical protein
LAASFSGEQVTGIEFVPPDYDNIKYLFHPLLGLCATADIDALHLTELADVAVCTLAATNLRWSYFTDVHNQLDIRLLKVSIGMHHSQLHICSAATFARCVDVCL